MSLISDLLVRSAAQHTQLCPRQILGVRLGMLGLKTLGFTELPDHKRMLVILETDGCFADGVIAATGCTVGHRTMRVEDYGKTAAVFVDTVTGQAERVAPALDIREKAYSYSTDASSHYFAQMQAYQVMPDHEMFTVMPVNLYTPVEVILSRPGVRVSCDLCGEEIMNEREVRRNGLTLCKPCDGGGYCQPVTQRLSTLQEGCKMSFV